MEEHDRSSHEVAWHKNGERNNPHIDSPIYENKEKQQTFSFSLEIFLIFTKIAFSIPHILLTNRMKNKIS